MPIRDRLRRVWRWAATLVGASPGTSPPPPHRFPLPSAPVSSASPFAPASQSPSSPPPPGPGDIVIAGPVAVRLWTVGGLVVLATTDAEAERALNALLGDGDLGVRLRAGELLEVLRGERAVAA